MSAFLAASWAFLRRLPWPVWAALAAVLAGLWMRESGYRAGVAAEQAVGAKALAAAAERYARQVEHDAQVTREIVRAKDLEIARIAADAADRPVGPIRVCLDPVHTGAVPAVPTLAGGAGAAGLPGGNRDGLRPGAGDGVDIGPGVQRLAVAYDIRNAQVRALLERHRRLSELAAEAERQRR